jgi:putative DNA primase/helicase
MMIHTSTFQDLKAGKIDAMDVSPEQLLGWFQNPMRAASKTSLRLLALRRFGDLRSERGSLRHDANVISVTGLTGDYDAGKVSIDDAVALLKRESVRAMLFTSPSSTEARPRWRVLAPVSAECGPDEHLELMGKLNAVLGGVLASESFTLSQAYFYGKADDAAHYETRDTLHMNRWIDQVDIEPVFPKARVTSPVAKHLVASDTKLRTGDGRRETLKSYIASVSKRGLGPGEIDALVKHFVEQHFDLSDPVDWSDVSGMIKWASDRDAAQRVEVSQVVITRERPRAVMVKASTLTPEPIRWLWPGWLARGKLHILAGAPGTGKTTIAISLAATLSAGGRWPDGTRSAAASVVVWSGEDDAGDVLQPRLALAGADLDRVRFLTGISEQGKDRSFDPAHDIASLRDALVGQGVQLLIIDPIVSAIAGDSHKNAEVRRGLQQLVDLAVEMGVAVLGITHLSKGTAGRDPLERVTGSLAFGAVARVVFIAAKNQDQGDDGRDDRLFVRVKSNIGADGDGFAYGVEQGEIPSCPGVIGSAIRWGEALHGEARELLADADASPDASGDSMTDAKTFLADLLAAGPVPVKAIRADAEGAGYSWGTIRRAQSAIGVEAVKQGGNFGGPSQKWVWRMPTTGAPPKMLKSTEGAEGAQVISLSTFSKSEHLQSSKTIEVDI